MVSLIRYNKSKVVMILKHKEYINIKEDSNTAVLFIYGILGTPNHFNDFIPLIPKSFSVYNMLLDGHGKGVKDFSKTSMKKWEGQVASVVEELSATHEKIYIVAHSLGTLLSFEQALKNKKICKLFFLAAPLSLFIKPKIPVISLKVYIDKIRPNDYKALSAKNCYSIAKDKNPFNYIGWIPRFIELFIKIRKTRKTINLLNTPCFVYQSKKDEMVSKKSLRYLKQNSHITTYLLERSGHFYYEKTDWDFLLNEFVKIINDN